MNLYLNATTRVADLVIDYIDVKLTDGSTVSLNWNESYIDRDDTGFSATYKGVCFGEDNANGRIDELQGMQVVKVGLFTKMRSPATISITEMEFEDGEKRLSFISPYPKSEDTQSKKQEGSLAMLTSSEKIKLWSNYDKRLKFIREYLKWDEWLRVETLGLVFYKYELSENTWLIAMSFTNSYKGKAVRYYIHDPRKPFQPYPQMEHVLENVLKVQKMQLQKELKSDKTAKTSQDGESNSPLEPQKTNEMEG